MCLINDVILQGEGRGGGVCLTPTCLKSSTYQFTCLLKVQACVSERVCVLRSHNCLRSECFPIFLFYFLFFCIFLLHISSSVSLAKTDSCSAEGESCQCSVQHLGQVPPTSVTRPLLRPRRRCDLLACVCHLRHPTIPLFSRQCCSAGGCRPCHSLISADTAFQIKSGKESAKTVTTR